VTATQLLDRDDFLEAKRIEEDASDHTLRAYRSDLDQFAGFLAAFISGEETDYRGNRDRRSGEAPEIPATAITSEAVRAWSARMHEARLSAVTIGRKLAAVRSFGNFLCREGILDNNPARQVRNPKTEQRLPRFLTESDVDALLGFADRSPTGCRDRALLELLYATGLRASEIVGLNSRSTPRDDGKWMERPAKTRLRLSSSVITAVASRRTRCVGSSTGDCARVPLPNG